MVSSLPKGGGLFFKALPIKWDFYLSEVRISMRIYESVVGGEVCRKPSME